MGKKIDRLSATLVKLLKARGLEGGLSEYRIAGQWEKSVGKVIALHARPASVRGKKLTLVVDSPAWMQQLSLLKPELVLKVNDALGRDVVRDITLKLGELASPGRRSEERAVPTPLTAEERERIERYVRELHDPDVRESLRRLIEKDFESRKGAAAGKETRK
jgi:hypothetical protein